MQFLLTGLMVIAEENCSRQETFLFGDLKTTVAFTVLEWTISAGAITWVRGWSGPGGEIREEGTPRRWAVMLALSPSSWQQQGLLLSALARGCTGWALSGAGVILVHGL